MNKDKYASAVLAEIHARLHYCQETGEFTWAVNAGGLARKGTKAGRLDGKGYSQIMVNGTRYMAHHLAWLWVYGQWPTQTIDHINGMKTDNRIENLRDISDALNKQNVRIARKDSSTGLLGVRKNRNRFTARLRVNGKTLNFGTYDTPQEAHEAYLVAKRKLHPCGTI